MTGVRLGRRICVSLLLGTPVAAEAEAPGAAVDTVAPLAVPYVAQTVLLCGGAAVVMVERWWGRRGVFADEFAHLVRPALHGILTTDLAAATRARGWATETLRGSPARVEQLLAQSVPPIVLINVAPGRYHYVVVLRWTPTEVTFHDPAVGPSTRMPTTTFQARWEAADAWMMVLRPLRAASPPTQATPNPPSTDSLPCRPWLDRAVDAAVAGRLAEAEGVLATARDACPGEPLALRELAAIRFRQGRHADAARLSADYLALAPRDSLGWQLFASSHYLAGDTERALQAWNTIGRPTVDLVEIVGLDAIRYHVLATAMGVSPGTVLTARQLALARRRLADVPAVALGRVSYEPVPGGLAELRAAVVERPPYPTLPGWLLTRAGRAVAREEAGLAVASPLGAGEVWHLDGRWTEADPQLAGRLAIPGHVGMPIVVSLESRWDRFRFEEAPEGPASPDARRRATSVELHGWVGPDLDLLAATRLEDWSSEGRFVALALGGGLHRWDDRVVLAARGEYAVPLGETGSYRRLASRLDWTSSPAPATLIWSARLGAEWASPTTPRGLWPITGGDLGRAIPLRGHSFAPGGVLPDARSGRLVIHGGIAVDRVLAHLGVLSFGVGVFLDGAAVSRTASNEGGHRGDLDGGIGLLLGMLGAPDQALRLDLARGSRAGSGWRLGLGLQQRSPLRLWSRP